MSANNINLKLLTKIGEAASFTLGPALVAFNVFNFNITKSGFLYYRDDAQYGIAIGVFLISLAFVMRNWRK